MSAGPPEANGDGGLRIKKTWFPGRWRTIRTIWRNFRLQNRTYADQCDLTKTPCDSLWSDESAAARAKAQEAQTETASWLS